MTGYVGGCTSNYSLNHWVKGSWDEDTEDTLPKTNIFTPENGCFLKMKFPIGDFAYFQGQTVTFTEGTVPENVWSFYSNKTSQNLSWKKKLVGGFNPVEKY